jgi:hypothetical protein
MLLLLLLLLFQSKLKFILGDFDEAKRVAFADHIIESVANNVLYLDDLIMTDECVMDLTGN